MRDSLGPRTSSQAMAIVTLLIAGGIPAILAADSPWIKVDSDFEHRDFAAAAAGCEALLKGTLATEERRKCLYVMGLSYRELGRCDEALKILPEVLSIRPEEPAQPYLLMIVGNQKAAAQRAMGDCLFLKGRYAAALEAYETAVAKYHFDHFCGNAHAEQHYSDSLEQGLALEYLGRPGEAVEKYVQGIRSDGFVLDATIQDRLADLYEATGQFDELAAFAGQSSESQPTLKRLVELRELEHRGELASLVPALRAQRLAGAAWESGIRSVESEPVQAAKLLARHPGVALSLLKDQRGSWAYYALGLCHTKEASELLGQMAREEYASCPGSSTCMTIMHALTIAGETGKPVIRSLTKSPEEAAALRESYLAREKAAGGPPFPFPPLPGRVKLPDRAKLTELLTESRPKRDRSTRASSTTVTP